MHFGLCDTAPLMFPLTILMECKGNIINMSDPSIASCCFNENQVSEKMPLHSLLAKQWQMSKWREVDDHGHAISVSPGAKRMMTTWRPALWADAISICQYQVHNNNGGDNGEDGSGVQGREVHGQHCRKWVPVFQKVQISGRFIEVRGSGSLDHWGMCNP